MGIAILASCERDNFIEFSMTYLEESTFAKNPLGDRHMKVNLQSRSSSSGQLQQKVSKLFGASALVLGMTLITASGLTPAGATSAKNDHGTANSSATGKSANSHKGGKSSKGNSSGPSGSGKSGSGKSSSGGQAPAGNNGHIQIDEYTMDGGNGNDPHVGCGFSVSFFGYDAGTQNATIAVTPSSPTKGGTPFTVSTQWTTASRTGGNQLDQNVPISPAQIAAAFSGVAPAHQGYHAKIEVEVSGSQGSDDKHHTVWIAPCAPVTSSSTSASASDNSSSSSNSKLKVVELEKSNSSTGFVAGPVTASEGSTLELEFIVANESSSPESVTLRNSQCDVGTVSPTGPQTLSGGSSMTFHCTSKIPATTSRRFLATGSVSASSSSGVQVRQLNTSVVANVRPAHLVASSLPKAGAAKPVHKSAAFTG
jgi:hypothetical protein